MKNARSLIHALLVLLPLWLAGCTAPRAITHSGMVTPKGQVKAGGNLVGNFSTETAYRLGLVSKDAVQQLLNRDTVLLDRKVDELSAALISYALDPTGMSFDLYVRYGVLSRLDAGYKYGFGAHAFDAMYQFMGEPGGTGSQSKWYGSVGAQYSWQKTDLPGQSYLNRVDPLLGFEAVRSDVLVPLVFSYSFGPDEQYGHVAFGGVYQRSFLRYELNPGRLYQELPSGLQLVPALKDKSSYGAGGVFVNAKIGHRHVYLLPSLSVYYQNFGRFRILNGQQVSLSGWSILPSLGVQLWLGKGR